MWADSLLVIERAHLLRFMVWGGASLLLGATLFLALRARREHSSFLSWFALMTASWGAVDLGLALWAMSTLALRDLAGATRLDRFLWLNIGLDAGYVMVGFTLLVVGWRLARRAGAMGAGIAIIVQGAALTGLDLALAMQISR
ncbi:MAG: hypothetical protein ABIP93_11045 [Gemmatimonadaceae bacterium]